MQCSNFVFSNPCKKVVQTTDILKTDEANRKKSARKKFISYGIARGLMKAAPESPLFNSYRNTLFCKSVIISVGDRTHSRYCKNRWCVTCNAIRTAILINAYSESIKELKDMYFVTLTLPTCTADELPGQIERMQQAYRKIRQTKFWRENKPSGLKKEECTLRPKGLYHFHYHFLIDSKEAAKYLVKEWLKRFPEAVEKAQKIKKVKDPDKFPLELFKYFTKLFTKDKSNKRSLDFKRLDVIMCAMRGRRTFQPFGSLRKSEIDEDKAFDELVSQCDELPGIWQWHDCDWVETQTGALYSGWIPKGSLTDVFNEYCDDEEYPPPKQ